VYCLVLTWQGDSHEISLNKGRVELSAMIDHFVIRPQQDCLEAAHRLYRLAVQAGFTKGRLVPQVSRICTADLAKDGAVMTVLHRRCMPPSACM